MRWPARWERHWLHLGGGCLVHWPGSWWPGPPCFTDQLSPRAFVHQVVTGVSDFCHFLQIPALATYGGAGVSMRPWGWRLLTTWDIRCRLRPLEHSRRGCGGGKLQAFRPLLGSRPCLVLLGTQSQESPVVASEGLPLNQSEGGPPQGLFSTAEWSLCLQRPSVIHRRGAKWASWRRRHLIFSLGAGHFGDKRAAWQSGEAGAQSELQGSGGSQVTRAPQSLGSLGRSWAATRQLLFVQGRGTF